MKGSASKYLAALAILSAVWIKPAAALPVNDRVSSVEDTLSSIFQHPLIAGCESVFLLTDRETYIAGDNIWFTMAARQAGRKMPKSIAGYAELLTASGLPVAQGRILLDEQGTGNGTLHLPDTLPSGDYVIRGYTRAMRAYGPQHFFTSVIRIFNPYSLKDEYIKIIPGRDNPGPLLELFPEGGNAVPGTVCRIVVKTTGTDGVGVPAMVTVMQTGKTAADSVLTGDDGLGSLTVTVPAEGAIEASALIGQETVKAALNPDRNRHVSLATMWLDDGTLRIFVRSDGKEQDSGNLHLAVFAPGRITYYTRTQLREKEFKTDLRPGTVFSGINQVILYDDHGNVLSSRLFCYESRPEGSPELQITRGNGNDSLCYSVSGSYLDAVVTCSVSDMRGLSVPEISSMLSWWCDAGALADPFMRRFLTGKEGLSDNLMVTLRDSYMTQPGSGPESIMAETMGLVIEGSMTALKGGEPLPSRLIMMNLPGKECYLQYSITDENGEFRFIVTPGPGTRETVIYPADTTEKAVIRLFSPYCGGNVSLGWSVTKSSTEADRTAERMSINSQVMRIYGIGDTDTSGAALTDRVTILKEPFYGNEGQHILLSDFVALPDMEEVFFELLPAADMIKTRTGYGFKIYDPDTKQEIKGTPMLFIDGTVTLDASTIALLPVTEVESVDVLTSRFRIGELLLPPVISVITKKGDYSGQLLPQSALRIQYPFSTPADRHLVITGDRERRMPAYASTLVWQPLPAKGKRMEGSVILPRPDYSDDLTVRIVVIRTQSVISSTKVLQNRKSD